MDLKKHLILVKGEDKTEEIASCRYVHGKCDIKFNNASKEYSYSYENIRWLRNPTCLNHDNSRILKNGQYFYDMDSILQFEDYIRVFFKNGIIRSYHMSELHIEKNCLENETSKSCFEYFKQLADVVSIKTDEGKKLLSEQFRKIKFISDQTVLASYLNPASLKPHKNTLCEGVYFPFGCKLSQMDAVEVAFNNSVSIIEGPPGTGKTQTILNIIANAIVRGNTVAVVSGNNYDYVIIDESSQVDLITGVLALSCAKNAVIVGDLKQLPHVVTNETKAAVEPIFNSFNLDTGYEYNNSLLSSVCTILPDAPRTLLKEHYRCHPKIIEFCNLKFYNNQLIIMTDDNRNTEVMKAYKTVMGNHARGHYNQRQIDEIRERILPQLQKDFNGDEIGIISPYRKQTSELIKELIVGDLEISTVHKFQGREKEAVVITTVDNEISEFADNPNLLNVAVSRAKKRLYLVVSDNEKNDNTNIGDLIKYIKYNNFEVAQGTVYSVFDLLYKDYTNQRLEFLKKHKKVSSYDSENLVYGLIKDILQTDSFCKFDVIIHEPLNMLIKNPEKLTDDECKYAMNPATHVDFLIYNKLDRLPVLVVEADGYWFHKEGTRQFARDELKNAILDKYNIPFIRLSTAGSMERERIIDKMKSLI